MLHREVSHDEKEIFQRTSSMIIVRNAETVREGK